MPNENMIKAYELYKKGLKLVDIAVQLGVPPGTVRRWKSEQKWSERSDERSAKKRKGGQPKNKNAVGNKSSPPGNKKAVKTGVYESIYREALPEDERKKYDTAPSDEALGEELQLLRYKLSRLLSRKELITYDMFGNKIEREITEQEREGAILQITDQIRRIVDTMSKVRLNNTKIQDKITDEAGNDGFIEALDGKVDEVWKDE